MKGRAKGTSVQEVVCQLEVCAQACLIHFVCSSAFFRRYKLASVIVLMQQATGAVLVSHEPTKIILYRGWGGGVDIGRANSGQHDIQASVSSMAVSPELLEAMRLECGLSIN